jgi:hypothetical protein
VGTEKRERQKANRALKQEQIERAAARRKTLRWVVIGVGAVAGVFLLAWIASTIVGDDDDPATPTETIVPADVTLPDATLPEVTLPEATVPATTTG